MKCFANEGVRVVVHSESIVKEDDLDSRWEEATGEIVDEVIFFSKHTAVSNRPALTVHPIGTFYDPDIEIVIIGFRFLVCKLSFGSFQ